jgi:hypothetical protein
MSKSIKVSSFSQTEDQFIRQQGQLRNLEGQMDNIIVQAKQDAERIAQSKFQDLRNQMDHEIHGLENEMARQEGKHRAAMKRQADEFYAGINDLREWTGDQIGELGDKMDKSFARQQQEINCVRSEVAGIYQREADEKKRAQLMIKDLDILLKDVNERTNHDKYAPGRLKELQKRFSSFSNGSLPPAAAIALATSLTSDLWDLEEDILRKQLKFEAIHNLVLKEAIELLQIMSRNRSEVYFTDEDGNRIKDDRECEVKVELDFWTQDEYGARERQAQSLKDELESQRASPNLSEDRVKEIFTELEKIKFDQGELIKLALRRGMASEERVRISEDIINAMLARGFEVKILDDGIPAHNYLGGEMESDQREGVFAILRNGNGTEISVIIHPDETLTKNHVVFQRNDDTSLSEDELRKSIYEVKDIISKQGYQMGDVAPPKGTGDKSQYELADANALAKVGIKKELKRQLGFINK